jgi:photosystem II stability/assembly factor-like uncharacterized protein
MLYRQVVLMLIWLAASPSVMSLLAQEVAWIQPQSAEVDASFRGIAVRSAREAWVGGSQGMVIRTRDAGKTWSQVRLPDADDLDFRDIALPQPNVIVLLAAGESKKSRIYRSDDDGRSWTLTLTNQHPQGFFNAIAFADANHGWLIGDPIDGKLDLYRTTDGGQSWQRQSGPEMLAGEYGFAASGTNIVAIDRELRIATGGAAARVLRSSDAGHSWAASVTPLAHGNESSGIFSIAFRDAKHGVAVGGDYQNPDVDNGNVARTTDGGVSWSLALPAGQIPHKACVRHIAGETWMTVGRTGVAVSHDDGRTWQTVTKQSFFTFAFDPSSQVGWLAGSEGRVARFTLPPR